LYTSTEISRFNLADGLKKAGTFGGTLPESDEAGTNSLVLPSMVSTNSEELITVLGLIFIVPLFISNRHVSPS